MTTATQNTLIPMDDLTILRIRSVISRTGLSRSMIYNMIAKGEFPHPISLGQRSVGWIKSEVVAWVINRMESSRINH